MVNHKIGLVKVKKHEKMKKQAIEHLEGKRVSIIIRGVERNVEGVLHLNDDDTVTVKQISSKIDDIVSILVTKEGEQWKNKENATYVPNA